MDRNRPGNGSSPSRPTQRERAALRAWRAALGARSVVTDRVILEQYETATFATTTRILVVLRPGTATQVAEALRVAARHGIPVHPVSRGCSWGYGCRVPPTQSAAVLELGRLDRIRDFNDALGHVTVEPGVTFRQLAGFLARRRSHRVAPRIGSSPDASVLANALERGIGLGRLANRIETLCALDVVLSTGERLRTGFDRLPRASCGPLHRLGVGPSLEGLFSQSSLGVVVGASVWLERRPAHVARMNIEFGNAKLGTAIAALRQLVQGDLLRSVIKLNNRYARLMASYPGAVRAQGAIEIPRPLELPAAERTWASLVELTGDDPRELRARARHVRAVLHSAVDRVSRVWTGPWVQPDPRSNALEVAYWRAPPPIGAATDPRRDSRGVLFCCPAVPLEPGHVVRSVRLLERAFLARAFEPYVTVNLMDERVAHVVSGIFYDRRVPGEDDRAMRAYRAAFAACARNGYYPYRLGNQAAGELPVARDASDDVLERVARALDPTGILSNGRYRPRRPGAHRRGS